MEIESWPDGATYRFDRAEYDERTDCLRLSYGPPTAASAEFTPEGHVVNVAIPEPYLCGLVLRDVTRRLADEGRITVTLGPLSLVTLGPADVAALLTHHLAQRTNRFARRPLRSAA